MGLIENKNGIWMAPRWPTANRLFQCAAESFFLKFCEQSERHTQYLHSFLAFEAEPFILFCSEIAGKVNEYKLMI